MNALCSACFVFLVGVLGAVTAPAGHAATAPTAAEAPLVITSGYGVDGLVLWLAADRGVTIDDRSRVTSLVDGTRNFTLTPQIAGRGPLYVPAGLNGKPVFRFDGSRSLYSPDNFGTELNRDMTLVIVAMANKPEAGEQFAIYLGENATLHANRAYACYKGLELFDGQFVGFLGKPAVKGAFVMTAASVNSSLNQSAFYRNGRQTVVTGIAKECEGTSFADLSESVTFGAATDPVCGWNGDIAEVLVYNRQLSPAEVQAIWFQLSIKYALQQTVATPAPTAGIKPAKP